MEKYDKEPISNMWEAGMLDQFIRGMWWQIKNEAEQIYSKDMDKYIRAFRIHEFLITTLAYIVHLGECDIYCKLNDLAIPKKENLDKEIKVWFEFKKTGKLKNLDKYFLDRAMEVVNEEERLKKEEEESKDE